MTLPATNAHVELRLLNGGSMKANTNTIHHGVEEGHAFRLYDWCFYIYQPDLRRHVLWDVGMSNDGNMYISSIRDVMKIMSCVGPDESLGQQLRGTCGVEPESIDTVLFSHAHFDHCRPIEHEFPNAHGFFGPGTEDDCKEKLEPGCTDPKIGHKFDPRFFDRAVSTEKWSELTGPWVPFGPFERAVDFFGNGSLWVIQAPGHMKGNLCAAARLEDGSWVVLGSDCAHTKPLLDGKYDIAEVTRPDGSKWSLHEDVCAAKETIASIRKLEVEYGCHIALAHDASWMLKDKEGDQDPVLFGLLGDEFTDDVRGRVARDEPF
ncbi:hypothetical protein RBB50_002567 [Rhinocladiella similis]